MLKVVNFLFSAILFHQKKFIFTSRWILCANHMEPVKGFLGRYLRRKLLESEAKDGSTNADMARVLDWIPKVWQQLNKFLEAHSSSDVTIGRNLPIKLTSPSKYLRRL